MMENKRYIVNLNEVSLIAFLLLLITRRNVYIFDVRPFISRLEPILTAIAEWAFRTKRALNLVDEYPDIKPICDYVTLTYGHDVFRKLEPWHNSWFKFQNVSEERKYDRAYKLVVGNYVHFQYPYMFLLHSEANRHDNQTFIGVSKDLKEMTGAYFDDGIVSNINVQILPTFFLINTAFFLLGFIFTTGMILRRVRLIVKSREYFLGADYNFDSRNQMIYSELEDGGDIFLLVRDRRLFDRLPPETKKYTACTLNSGCFNPFQAIVAVTELAVDMTVLFCKYGWSHPRLFYQIVVMPARKLLFRSLFNRFKCKYFWGRDDYNVEHILRHQELRRIGAKSFGISHAAQGICILLPMWRYISFDTYYLLADIIYNYYKDTWPLDMTVKTTGTFAFSRAELTTNRVTTNSILFMSRFTVGDKEAIRTVRLLAKTFPDYNILVQVKLGYPHDRDVPRYVDACKAGLKNVQYVTDPVYELVLKTQYLVTDASTIISEALQLAVPTFMLDIIPNHETCIYREFDGLCHRTAEGIVQKIGAIMNRSEQYPFDDYAGLYNSSETIIYDIIRSDMGVPGTI
jgi:hypothetical protein